MLMKKWLIAGVIGCVLMTALTLAKKYYNTPFLEKAERIPTPETETTVEQKTTYKDNFITITWNPDPLGFYFELVNKFASPLRIIWAECYLHDPYSKYTIVHGGIRDPREMPLPA
ncbi:MAG: hypothetical protein JSV88_09125 [Candidatus Aminicenantes bacterium]|nr:MAG: hypothetical protein JSV88_09125 [Candidatus Aminicenantes bacterium]